ncbi:hypothetical protein GB2207_05704 [marine gamma proteobacterium HTCC2207]|uniref:Uncharacterized protein n=1 Tax=gamma proteobacterium HTCC2207 TaxID=314287 RepID=Q1YPX8_9GAMM|nr:hypothetical protein GB2207_05704 [marine gamma proteobacterium HTCC2207] [gamma proteobacterium HTCC2207]
MAHRLSLFLNYCYYSDSETITGDYIYIVTIWLATNNKAHQWFPFSLNRPASPLFHFALYCSVLEGGMTKRIGAKQQHRIKKNSTIYPHSQQDDNQHSRSKNESVINKN